MDDFFYMCDVTSLLNKNMKFYEKWTKWRHFLIK